MIYEQALAGVEVTEFPIHGIDRLGIPVWTAAAWTPDGTFCNGVGYGATDAEARRSAWGELWEAWCAVHHLAATPPLVAPFAEVRDRALDPLTLCLPAGSPYAPDRPLAWLPGVRAGDGADVLVPLEWVATRFADLPDGAGLPEPLVTPITNGLGAHGTLEDAARHALRELQQRDGNSVAYRALDRGHAIVPDDPGEELGGLLARFDEAGVDVRLKLAAPTPGAWSVYVTGHDRDPDAAPHPLALAACGEAADPDPRRALRKALLEFAAARSRRVFNHAPFAAFRHVLPDGYEAAIRARPPRSEEERSLRATLRWSTAPAQEVLRDLEPVLAVRRATALSDLGAPPAAGDDGFVPDPVVVDLTPPGAAARAAKVVAPGLEVETMSYGRIGPRNLRRLLHAGERFVGVGGPPPGAAPLRLPPGSPDAWLHPRRLEERVGVLYALYREPARHVAALAAEDEEALAA